MLSQVNRILAVAFYLTDRYGSWYSHLTVSLENKSAYFPKCPTIPLTCSFVNHKRVPNQIQTTAIISEQNDCVSHYTTFPLTSLPVSHQVHLLSSLPDDAQWVKWLRGSTWGYSGEPDVSNNHWAFTLPTGAQVREKIGETSFYVQIGLRSFYSQCFISSSLSELLFSTCLCIKSNIYFRQADMDTVKENRNAVLKVSCIQCPLCILYSAWTEVIAE